MKKSEANIKMVDQESKKPKGQKTSQSKVATVLRVTVYTFMWLLAWSCVVIALAIGLLVVAMGVLPKEDDGITYLTAEQANNTVLVIILIISAIFFGFVWLLRKKESLSYRVSRKVLFICTVIGLLVGVPLSLLGVWEPGDTQQNQVDTNKNVKRYQYMLCSDGSSLHYTDEQMKTPGVGFIDKGEDYCKKNGQGKMTKLSNKKPETKKGTQSQSTMQRQSIPVSHQPSDSSSSSKENCSSEDIPYRTIREEKDWLYAGEERVIPGYVGSKQVCRDASGKVTSTHKYYDPINKIIYYGTSPRPSQSQPDFSECDKYRANGLSNSTYYGDCVERLRNQYYGN